MTEREAGDSRAPVESGEDQQSSRQFGDLKTGSLSAPVSLRRSSDKSANLPT